MFSRSSHEWKTFWVVSLPGLLAFLFSRAALSGPVGPNAEPLDTLLHAPVLQAQQISALPAGVVDSRLSATSEQLRLTDSIAELQYGGQSFNFNQLLHAQTYSPMRAGHAAHPFLGESPHVVDLTVKPMFPNLAPDENPWLNAPGFRVEDYFRTEKTAKEAH